MILIVLKMLTSKSYEIHYYLDGQKPNSFGAALTVKGILKNLAFFGLIQLEQRVLMVQIFKDDS